MASTASHGSPRQRRGSFEKKQRIYNKAKKSGMQKHWDHFHTVRKQCTKAANRDHWTHVNNLVDPDEDKTSKNLWSYIKSKKQDSCGVATLKADGNTYTDNKGKAETLSNQFKSVFTQEDTNKLPNKPPSPHPDVRCE
jgi:hypothetical protein